MKRSSRQGIKVHIGYNIRTARIYRGLKQKTLASALGVNQQIVSQIERQPQIEKQLLKRIADALILPVDFIKNFDQNIILSTPDYSFQINPFDEVLKSFKNVLNNEREWIEKLLKNNPSNYVVLPPSSHLGKRIDAVRRLKGVTQKELGNALGVTKQAVSKMERSKKIKPEKIKEVAKALGISEEKLKEITNKSELTYIFDRHTKKSDALMLAKESLIIRIQKCLTEEIQDFEKLKSKVGRHKKESKHQ